MIAGTSIASLIALRTSMFESDGSVTFMPIQS